MDVGALVEQLLGRVGDLWLGALFGSFFVMICESAKPKPADGESRAAPQGFALLAAILSLLTPLMLFIHAFATASGALIAIIAAIGGAVIGAALIGWVIGALAPDVGRTLNRAAPFLALPVFALAAYASWRSIFDLANMLVAGFVR